MVLKSARNRVYGSAKSRYFRRSLERGAPMPAHLRVADADVIATEYLMRLGRAQPGRIQFLEALEVHTDRLTVYESFADRPDPILPVVILDERGGTIVQLLPAAAGPEIRRSSSRIDRELLGKQECRLGLIVGLRRPALGPQDASPQMPRVPRLAACGLRSCTCRLCCRT